jgi:hypothetical protein
MELGNPTYEICKKCLGSTNGTFYWKIPPGQTEFDRQLEYYVGRCVTPDTGGNAGGAPAEDEPPATDADNSDSGTAGAQTSPQPKKRLWSAVAAGVDGGFMGITTQRVGVGLGQDYATREEAERGAKSACKKKVKKCKVVATWNSGCYYITTGNGGGVAWGSGSTPQIAYDQCRKRVTNCDTSPIGGCYPE